MPLLKITVALGQGMQKRKNRRERWFKRYERLLKVIEKHFPQTDPEHPMQDAQGRWSYSCTIEGSLKDIRKILHDNGRFKLLKAVDVEHSEVVYVTRTMIVERNN